VETVVEVGDWEHECCGPAYERDSLVELSCLVVPGSGGVVRYLETHHGPSGEVEPVEVRGRVADVHIVHTDGSTEQIQRLPSGRALRGFDDRDDGHLERAWTGEPVANDSYQFLVTVVG
jgi:hypothetical protein